MSRKKSSPYQNWLCRKALWCVFDTLDFGGTAKFDTINFNDKDNGLDTKKILYQSYLCNLGLMREYAVDNNIDEMAYILSLRDILLRVPGVHEYEL